MSNTALRFVAAAAMTVGIGFVGAGQATGADCSLRTPCAHVSEPQLMKSVSVMDRDKTKRKPREKAKPKNKSKKPKNVRNKRAGKDGRKSRPGKAGTTKPRSAKAPARSNEIEDEIKAVLEVVNRLTALKNGAPNLSTLDVSGVGFDQDLAGLPGSSAFPASPASTRRLASELPELPVTPDPVTGRLPGPLPAVNVQDPVGVELDRAVDVKADKSAKEAPSVQVLKRPEETDKVPFLDETSKLTNLTGLLRDTP